MLVKNNLIKFLQILRFHFHPIIFIYYFFNCHQVLYHLPNFNYPPHFPIQFVNHRHYLHYLQSNYYQFRHHFFLKKFTNHFFQVLFPYQIQVFNPYPLGIFFKSLIFSLLQANLPIIQVIHFLIFSWNVKVRLFLKGPYFCFELILVHLLDYHCLHVFLLANF